MTSPTRLEPERLATASLDLADEVSTLAVHAEDISITKSRVVSGITRVETVTRSRQHEIDEPLVHERVEVERVAIGRPVDAAPAVRVEGDTTVIPVVEEVVVVERRLILKEEVRIRRVQVAGVHRETITLREQEVVVTRRPAGEEAAGTGPLMAETTQTNV